MNNMTFLQAVILGIIYFLGNSTAWSFGIGYYTLYRPVIAGLFIGVILGNPIEGMIAGAIANIVYLDFVSTGGSLKGDPCLAGVITAFLVVVHKFNPIEAVALAYPIGLIGIYLWKFRLSINSKLVKVAEREVDKGNTTSIILNNAIYAQIVLLITSIVTVVALVYSINFAFGITNNYLPLIRRLLYISGVLLLSFSVGSKLNQIHSNLSIIAFIIVYLFLTIFEINIVLFIIIVFLSGCLVYILKERKN